MQTSAPPGESIALQKRALRAQMLALRDAMPTATRATAGAACRERLLALEVIGGARTILSYWSFGAELATQPLFEHWRAAGRTVALPRVDRATGEIAIHRVAGHEELVRGQWGIAEPRIDCASIALADIDLVLVPGVAFDRAGHRLGYGKGYYDRLLSKRASHTLAFAISFDEQVVEQVPVTEYDQKIDQLVTPTFSELMFK